MYSFEDSLTPTKDILRGHLYARRGPATHTAQNYSPASNHACLVFIKLRTSLDDFLKYIPLAIVDGHSRTGKLWRTFPVMDSKAVTTSFADIKGFTTVVHSCQQR